MENFFKNVVVWGSVAVLFFWLQTSRVLDFGANPNFLILGLILAWSTGRLWPPAVFGILSAAAYWFLLPFDIWPLVISLIAGSVLGLAAKFFTGKILLDEVLAVLGATLLFNFLIQLSMPLWSVWLLELLATELALFLFWPLFKKIS